MIASRWVWLPDALFRRTVVLARWPLANGERLEVTQELTDDFYLTKLLHWDSFGSVDSYVIDNDMEKCWRCQVEDHTNYVLIRMPLNHVVSKYYPVLHSIHVNPPGVD